MTSGEINMDAMREVHPLKSCFIKKPITTDALAQRIKAELESSKSTGKSKILSAAIEVDQDYRRHLQARSVVIQEIHHKMEEDKIKSIINQRIRYTKIGD